MDLRRNFQNVFLFGFRLEFYRCYSYRYLFSCHNKYARIVGHCALGIDTDMQNDPDNVYMKKSMSCLLNNSEKLLLVKLSNVMPFLIPVLIRYVQFHVFITNRLYKMVPSLISNLPSMASLWIIERVKQIIKERLVSGKKRIDLLQLMLDATTHEEIKVKLTKI